MSETDTKNNYMGWKKNLLIIEPNIFINNNNNNNNHLILDDTKNLKKLQSTTLTWTPDPRCSSIADVITRTYSSTLQSLDHGWTSVVEALMFPGLKQRWTRTSHTIPQSVGLYQCPQQTLLTHCVPVNLRTAEYRRQQFISILISSTYMNHDTWYQVLLKYKLPV